MSQRACVIDTSVTVKWFLKEPFELQVLKVRKDFAQGNLRLLAPDMIYSEFGNTIWKQVVFHGLDPALGEKMILAFCSVPIEIIPAKSLIPSAFELAVRQKQSLYDCLFLALSQATNSILLTADETFYRKLCSSFPKLTWLGNWPIH